MNTTIYVSVAAVVLLVLAWLRIDALSSTLDACRADNRLIESVHADTTEQLADASQLLAEQVRQIEVREQAIEEAKAERDQVVKERNWAWYENSKLLDQAYQGSCAEWAETLMCAEAVEQWRSEYSQR